MTRKGITRRDIAKGITAATEPPDESIDPAADEVAELFRSLPSNATIEISRRGDESKQLEYCGVMSLDEFSLEAVREKYGGGYFAARGKYFGVDGKRSWGPQRSFRIAGHPAWLKREPPAMSERSGREAMSDALILGFMQAINRPAPPPFDIAAAVAAVAPIAAAVITVLGARKDPMDTAVKVAELMKQNEPKGGGFADIMGAFREGMAIARRVNGGDHPEPEGLGALAVAEKGLEVLNRFADGYVAQQQGKQSGNEARVEPRPLALVEGAAAPSRTWAKELYPYRDPILKLVPEMPPAQAAEELHARMSEGAIDDLLDDYDEDPGGFGQRAGGQLGFPAAAWPWLQTIGALVRAEYTDDEPGPVAVPPAAVPAPTPTVRITKGPGGGKPKA